MDMSLFNEAVGKLAVTRTALTWHRWTLVPTTHADLGVPGRFRI